MSRIHIREHVLQDLDAYVEWQSDPEVARHVAWLPRNRKQSHEGLLDAMAQQTAHPRVRYFFAVVRDDTAEIVGDVGFTVNAPLTGDCGWFIRRRFWGLGYATEAMRMLMEYAFNNVGLDRLTASCAAANAASEKVMVKCGLRLVERSGKRTKYEIKRTAWKEQAQPAGGAYPKPATAN